MKYKHTALDVRIRACIQLRDLQLSEAHLVGIYCANESCGLVIATVVRSLSALIPSPKREVKCENTKPRTSSANFTPRRRAQSIKHILELPKHLVNNLIFDLTNLIKILTYAAATVSASSADHVHFSTMIIDSVSKPRSVQSIAAN